MKEKIRVTVGGFVIDCVSVEEHQLESEITENPVESGGTVTDHWLNKNPVLSLDCYVTNTPHGAIAELRDPLQTPADAAYEHMIALRLARRPFVVETPRARYEKMGFRSIGIPISVETGKAIQFRLVCVEFQFVTNDRSTVTVPTPRQKKKKKRGPKTVKVATPEEMAATARGTINVGYNDTGLGQLTDSIGVTKGPNASIVPETGIVPTDEDRAVDAASKW